MRTRVAAEIVAAAGIVAAAETGIGIEVAVVIVIVLVIVSGFEAEFEPGVAGPEFGAAVVVAGGTTAMFAVQSDLIVAVVQRAQGDGLQCRS